MPDVGDTLVFRSDVYDAPPSEGGVLVNASSVALTITLPVDPVTGISATVAASVTNPPATTGKYEYRYPVSVMTGAGKYRGNWLFTMAGGETTAYVEEFDVEPVNPGYVISLPAAKRQLGIPADRTTFDEDLRLYMATVTRVVEYFVGPVVIRPYTEVLTGASPFLTYLPYQGPGLVPVLVLNTVTPFYTGGTSYAPAALKPNPITGEVRALAGTRLADGGLWTVVYTAGQQIVDPSWQVAAGIVLQHLWSTKRGASSLPMQSADETYVPGLGFAIPNRAIDLLQIAGGPGAA